MSDTTTTPAPNVTNTAGVPATILTTGGGATPSEPVPATQTAEPKPQPPATGAQEPELGDAGKKAIQQERQAREAAERELKAQRAALLKAFGVEQDKGGEDIVATLQQQVAAMQKDNVVNRVARRHRIEDDEDVELLRALPDEAAMDRFAARLRQQTPPAPTSPAPDPSQASAPLTPEAKALAEYEAFFPNKT